MNYKNKDILIYGFGKSGQAVFDYLKNFEANIYVYDKNLSCQILQKFNKNSIKINKKLKKTIFFNNFKDIFDICFNLCIVSPGVDLCSYEIKILKKRKIKIISELEFGMNNCKGKIIAVTGTNGKTTAVTLLNDILKQAKKEVFLCGNVGTPITEIAKRTTKKSFIICEVSSFQLELSNNIKPYISCILNVTPDHLNRHKTMTKYLSIKNKINQYYASKKVFNIDDELTNNLSKLYNNSIKISKKMIKIDKKSNKKYIFYKNTPIIPFESIKLIGNKNLENILSVIAISKEVGIENNYIKKGIENFKGLPHRLNIVETHNNITYINDSKSTNVASTLFALEALKENKINKNNIILLLGGSEKKLNFSPIFQNDYFKIAIIYGEIANKIEKIAKKYKKINILCKNFKIACKKSFEITKEKDVILLSPACASFDEFASYEDRGAKFIEYVGKFCNKNS